MTNKEKLDILLKYFGDEDGDIDLSDIDFGNKVVYNTGQKANVIYNYYQKARLIDNYYQEADEIDNGNQKAKKIYNNDQQAYEINNSSQAIKLKYEDMSKDELIEEIKKLKGE